MKSIFSAVWFKCITLLLSICLIAGGTLAILNDVLAVSPSERASRAIKSIYGEEKQYTAILDVDDDTVENNPVEYAEYGKIEKIFRVEIDNQHYDLLFKTTGDKGYKNGTLTLWVQVSVNTTTNLKSISKVLLESFEKQTLMSKLGASYYANFTLTDITEEYNDGKYFSPTDKTALYNPVSGATKSATAGCNAVNCVIKYVGENLGGAL